MTSLGSAFAGKILAERVERLETIPLLKPITVVGRFLFV